MGSTTTGCVGSPTHLLGSPHGSPEHDERVALLSEEGLAHQPQQATRLG